MKSSDSIAGMSIGGGKKENFFFATLEYFETDERWFLSSLKYVKEETSSSQEDIITNWVENSQLGKLIVDFPQTKPVCETCNLDCPGIVNCHHPVVNKVRKEIKELVDEDKHLVKDNPKKYEQERNADDEVNFHKDALAKETTDHMLSKSFKRKLKKGFTPYWNRPLDFWVWRNYYDQLLSLFNLSYDSFGNVSLYVTSQV